ncbi:unnamed protein product [Zymoseptoria tritici ST99CH_3D1]|nr:unnamed protein product [Zymoseptoria tritici ST99CH_3D1]
MSRICVSRLWQEHFHVCSQCRLSGLLKQRAQRSFHTTTARKSLLSLLEGRGYVNQIAGDRDALDRLLQKRKVGFYAGIDPTAPSLHLGHLLPLMVLFWLYRHGHHVVSLVGGATAKVGDPSGRLTSRAAATESTIDANFRALHAQIGGVWENAIQYGRRHGDKAENAGRRELLNNAAWLDKLSILDFLRIMGNGMRVGTMLGRDTVKNKMEKGDGMSFAEFTYPLLQGWDWWQMYQEKGVQIQIGGSDQYGNIIAGMDAVKYIAQSEAGSAHSQEWLDTDGRLKDELVPMGLTVPLLTTSSGEKFGKSAGNAVWLDRDLTSSFDLYGFLLRSSDADVRRYLKLFTFVPVEEIDDLMIEHAADPGKRKAQHLLASEVLELVHGPEEAVKTRAEHQSMRKPTLGSLASSSADAASDQSASGAQAAQRTRLPKSLVYNTPFGRIFYHAGLVSTKSEGARLVTKGGAYVATPGEQSADQSGGLNFVQVKDQQPAEIEGLVMGGLLVLRLGKWKVRVIEVVDDADYESSGQSAPGWTDFKARR